jgi:hypothetical protein
MFIYEIVLRDLAFTFNFLYLYSQMSVVTVLRSGMHKTFFG